MKQATPEEIEQFLHNNPAWSCHSNKLRRELEFDSFVDAFAFMTKVAFLAERNNHHPEWFNTYRYICIDLTTHELKGISDKDFQLASEIDKLQGTV